MILINIIMKKKQETIRKMRVMYLIVLIACFGFTFLACEDEFNKDEISQALGPPIIESVSEARQDVVVTQGVLEGTYIIRGENLASLSGVYFNGVQAGFNSALGTDNIAFVKVPEEAPYVNQPNIMTLENAAGFTEYDFSLLNIESFTQETVNGIKQVTLMGGDFTDTTNVTFVSGNEAGGNLVERPATIISISPTAVTVEVPDGVEQAFIFLSTSRGAIAKSSSYGFLYSIFIDSLNPDWNMSQWGGTFDAASTEVALGEFSIKSIREGWSGLTFLPPSIPFTTYNSITVSLYGTGAAGDSVNLAINDFSGSVNLVLVPSEWTTYVIPLSDFYPNGGEPSTITRLDFQESSGTGLSQYIFYVDDFGFL